MESTLPMLNCLLNHTLKSLCTSSEPSKWAYAVFWRILPRNFPPPKWEYGGGALDLINGNKRNWILVWDDGYCDFNGRFGANVFFKMSHEVYNYGEGLMGKLAADNNYRWIFNANSNDDPSFFSTWKGSVDPQPKTWEFQFKSGIQTIALIPVREGLIQLGSLDKVAEDPKLVANTQRKFNYLLSIPGISSIPRPIIFNFNAENHQFSGSKRVYNEGVIETPIKYINLGWQSMWYDQISSHDLGFFENNNNAQSFSQREGTNDVIKVEPESGEEYKPCCLDPNHDLDKSKAAKRSRFGTLEEANLVH